MVKVTFEQRNNKLTLRIKGHAGYAEIGKDIVCASCTILAYTVAEFVKEANNAGYLKSTAIIKLGSGDTVISCEPKDEFILDIQNMYFFAERGYSLLAQNYPQYVVLKQFGQPDEA